MSRKDRKELKKGKGQKREKAAFTPMQLRRLMEKELEPKRYQHTLGVAYTAAALAMRYNADMDKALTAGLLHDCAKNLSVEKQFRICGRHSIAVSAAEQKNPALLHAKVGSFLAWHRYGIEDREILDAISWHTTGRPEMRLLDKILYVADYIEPARNQAPNLPQTRKLGYAGLSVRIQDRDRSHDTADL